MIKPQDNIYFVMYIYIDLSTGNTLLQMFVKIVLCIYMYYNNNFVYMSSQTFYEFKTLKTLVQLS